MKYILAILVLFTAAFLAGAALCARVADAKERPPTFRTEYLSKWVDPADGTGFAAKYITPVTDKGWRLHSMMPLAQSFDTETIEGKANGWIMNRRTLLIFERDVRR